MEMSLDVYLYNDEKDIENGDEIYWANITHNLNSMASAAGIYKPMWRPEEINATIALHLIRPLKDGICSMIQSRKYLIDNFSPDNGWGDYDVLLNFAIKYLQACEDNPLAIIRVSK